MSLRGEIQNLCYAIAADIEHGECFYDEDMLAEFIENLDKLKEAATKYSEEIKAEDEED